MDIQQHRSGDAVVVAPVGRIDSTTSDALEKALTGLLDSSEQSIVVDFSGVDYISSAGLRVLLVVAKRQRDSRGRLELTALGASVRQVLDLAGFLPLFASTGVVISPAAAPSVAPSAATLPAGAPGVVIPAPATRASDGLARTLRLRIEAPGGKGAERSFDAASIIIGRSERADVAVADHSVSRQHARLVRQDQGWTVEDLGSRNGTLLNDQRLSQPVLLRPGDVIRVGDTRVTVGPAGGDESPWIGAEGSDDTAADESVMSVIRPAAEVMQVASSGAGASSRLRLLNEVHRALATPISRAELLELILDRTFDVLKPEDAAIFLRGSDGQLYQAAERRSPASTGQLLVSRRLAEEVTVKGAAALVLDARLDERFVGAESIVASGVRSIVAAPLLDSEGCLGMIALYSRIHVRQFSEADLELLVSLAAAAALRVRNLALAEEASRRQVLDREMVLAHDIQMGMLARRVPEMAEAELAARLRPARTVGGDLYDMVRTGDSLWFIVGDVSGKGFAAALVMAVAQTLFRALAPSDLSLPDLLGRMNRELCRENDRAMFVTACAGCLDLQSGRLQIANAGHNLPCWMGRDGSVRVLSVASGLALGVVEHDALSISEYRLEPGDGILIYTDGVCDALNPQGAAFGTPRIEDCLAGHRSKTAPQLVHDVFSAVDFFAGTAPQEDDITVVVLRYRGPGG